MLCSSHRGQRLHSHSANRRVTRVFALCCVWIGVLRAASVAAQTEPGPGEASALVLPSTAPERHATVERTVTVAGQRPTVVYGQRDATLASSVVLREQLERPGATASEALATLPGVSILRVGTPAEFASASVRGADSRQIPVYLANIPLNDDVSGSADLSMLPLWMVQRIEVYRGASPQDGVRAGLAGAVYFEPLRPTRPGVGALLSVGSFGERGLSVRAAVGSRHASSLLAVRYARADNDYPFINDHGQRFDLIETLERRKNADYSDVEVWNVSEWSTRSGVRMTAVLQGMRREQGATSTALSPALNARAERQRLLAGLSAEVPCNEAGDCKLRLATSALNASTTLRDAFNELLVTGGDWMHQEGRRFIQSAQLEVRPTSVLALSGLLFHASENLQLRHDVAPHRDAEQDELGLSLQAVAFSEHALSPALLVSARCAWSSGEFVRLSQVVQREGNMCALEPPDVRAGLRYEITSGVKLLSNFGRSTQIPNLGQLYGVNAAVTGNADLQPEVSYNLDLGMRGDAGRGLLHVDWEAFGFARWASDLIQYRRTSLNTVSPFNMGRARFMGVEVAASAVAWGIVQSRTALTLLDPRRLGVDADDNPILPLQARLQVSQSLTAVSDLKRWGLGLGSASVHYRHQASRYMDPTGLIVLPAQHRLDADIRVEVPSLGLRLLFAVNNLTDNRMLDLLGLPLPGRAFNGSLEGNLN